MTFLVIVSLLFLSIPIGFGFALAVYLKREYEHLASADDSSTASENVLDILKSSGVAQDILSAEKPKEELNQTPAEENKSGEASKEESVPLPQEQIIEPSPEPPPPSAEPALEVSPENAEQKDAVQNDAVQNDDGNPLLQEQNGLVDEAMGTLEPSLHTETDALSEMELLKATNASLYFGSTDQKTSEEELGQTTSEKIEPAESIEKPEAEEILDKDFDFDALKNILAESKEETVEKAEAEELLGKDFDFDTLKNLLDEPKEETVEKPAEELNKEPIPKITKSTFENIPVYESVPEELLETHLCVDEEFSSDAAHSDALEIRDSFAVVPESLLDRIEIDSSPGAENFVQSHDVAITILGRKKKSEE